MAKVHLEPCAALTLLRRVAAVIPISALVALVATSSADTADLTGDLSIDSTIELVQQTGEGPDRVITISMTTQLGETLFAIDRDGQRSETSMPAEECIALWDYLLERDIGNMTDAPLENPYPDQSVFIYKFKNGLESNTFSAYGVDFLTDTRYREIARAIIDVANNHSP
jgi:hypothetical protein